MILDQQIGTYSGARADYFGFGYGVSLSIGLVPGLPDSVVGTTVSYLNARTTENYLNERTTRNYLNSRTTEDA